MSSSEPTPKAGMREEITDTHVHLWDLSASPYAWLAGAPQLRRTTSWEDARPGLEGLGVTRVVLVQADDTREDTAFLQREAARIEAAAGRGGAEMAAGAVGRADVVGWLPLEQPEQVARMLADTSAIEHLVGVRHLVHDEPDPGFLERPEVARSLGLLGAAGLALDIPDAAPRHMEQVARLATAHPELVIVLDHLGKPPLGDREGMERWDAAVRPIADRDRTIAKISGLSTAGNGAIGEVRRAIDRALELFGPQRCMVGSDWPIAPEPFDAASGLGVLLEEIGGMRPEEREHLLRGTAARVYRRIGEGASPASAPPSGV